MPPHFPPPPPRIPLVHILTGLLASFLSAAGIAWYVVKPVRRLRQALAAATAGDLNLRIGQEMGHRRDELADLGSDFDRMSAHLQALMGAQRRLLHDVSHELRSPLARLQAAIGLARQQPDRFDESMDRLEREGERMNHLVGELLTLSRLEAGETQAAELIDLSELLADLVDDARFEGAARRLVISLKTTPGLCAHADAAQLHRAIDNVLRNALRHAPSGSEISVTCMAADEQHSQIIVEDQGDGAPADLLESLFEPFVRATPQDGFGLGLAIARRAITGARGDIRAENIADGGFRIHIQLPQPPSV